MSSLVEAHCNMRCQGISIILTRLDGLLAAFASGPSATMSCTTLHLGNDPPRRDATYCVVYINEITSLPPFPFPNQHQFARPAARLLVSFSGAVLAVLLLSSLKTLL